MEIGYLPKQVLYKKEKSESRKKLVPTKIQKRNKETFYFVPCHKKYSQLLLFSPTFFSSPNLFVNAASLKQCIQTALSLTTLSAKGTRSNMLPKACESENNSL